MTLVRMLKSTPEYRAGLEVWIIDDAKAEALCAAGVAVKLDHAAPAGTAPAPAPKAEEPGLFGKASRRAPANKQLTPDDPDLIVK